MEVVFFEITVGTRAVKPVGQNLELVRLTDPRHYRVHGTNDTEWKAGAEGQEGKEQDDKNSLARYFHEWQERGSSTVNVTPH